MALEMEISCRNIHQQEPADYQSYLNWDHYRNKEPSRKHSLVAPRYEGKSSCGLTLAVTLSLLFGLVWTAQCSDWEIQRYTTHLCSHRRY